MATQPNPSDEFLWYEYLQSDLFWIIAFAILCNYAITSQEIDPENIYVKRKFDEDEIWEGEGELASVTQAILAT
ncbi:hypothetical protein FBULB1_44 [Fusarium bulbicola]|nr:hypothetical protein FBULB1_44 [Fusarium bulbicola]